MSEKFDAKNWAIDSVFISAPVFLVQVFVADGRHRVVDVSWHFADSFDQLLKRISTKGL